MNERRGEVLWEPPSDARESTRLGQFMSWVEQREGRAFDDYQALWRYSVDNLESFWGHFASFVDVKFESPPTEVLGSRVMPGATWFPGSKLNYAAHVLDGPSDSTVLESLSQARVPQLLSRGELREQVARVRRGLEELGVRQGDRVVAYLPNIPETAVALLACASMGAVFMTCAPELGARAVIDRIRATSPEVLLAIDGYRFGDKAIDRLAVIDEIRVKVPTITATVIVPYLSSFDEHRSPGSISWEMLMSFGAAYGHRPVPFNHPLYILFSSGSTGPPKAIVHGHGGIVLEHLKWFSLHADLSSVDAVFWPTSTSWMAWNVSVSTLMCGGRLVTFDGDLTYQGSEWFWSLISDRHISHLGTSPAFLAQQRRSGVTPRNVADLSCLKGISCGGSPLSAEGFRWVYDAISSDLLLASVSGGTDLCTSFVGGAPMLPVRAGEISCRFLGAKVESYNEHGKAVIGEQGELVLTAPTPSMPVELWGDTDGSRYRDTYFKRFEGVWCHGDWIVITEDQSVIITGRSDATLNRNGVRIGTSEMYSVLEDIDVVSDCLVIHLGGESGSLDELVLFVVPVAGLEVDSEIRSSISSALRNELSPRHVPDLIVAVSAIPRTITGKRMEVPVKRLLLGDPPESVAAATSMVDPTALDEFVRFAWSRGNSA